MTKHRQRKYWWWSYRLLQTVQVYGIDNYLTEEKLVGPFFTGMSFIMIIPEFKTSLYSPTSTSVQIQVAMKFSGHQGIILEFHNNNLQDTMVKGFDVPSISRYREEDERYSCILSLIY